MGTSPVQEFPSHSLKCLLPHPRTGPSSTSLLPPMLGTSPHHLFPAVMLDRARASWATHIGRRWGLEQRGAEECSLMEKSILHSLDWRNEHPSPEAETGILIRG